MKIEDFEFAAEIWWQRAKKLIRYAQSEENPYKRRYKAFVLYLIMYQRVRNCTNIYQFLSRAKKPVIFKEGGQIIGKSFSKSLAKEMQPEEFIISKPLTMAIIKIKNFTPSFENLKSILDIIPNKPKNAR